MKSFIKIVLLLIIPLNLYSQEIIETTDVLDMFSDKTIKKDELNTANKKLDLSTCQNIQDVLI